MSWPSWAVAVAHEALLVQKAVDALPESMKFDFEPVGPEIVRPVVDGHSAVGKHRLSIESQAFEEYAVVRYSV